MKLGLPLVATTLTAAMLLGGCENGVRNMYHEGRNDPLTSSSLWPDGRSSRPLEAGTIALSAGPLAESSSGRAGLIPAPGNGPLYTTANLERGRQKFNIYCAPCHGPAGDGDGYITRRGFPHPPSYHSTQLRGAPDSLYYDVITNGYGIMYPYGDRLAPADRWNVIAYIRALQLAEHAPLSDVPAAERQRLQAEPPP
ncbi:MAG: c-type cytochrome [Steroidobacteraceae bacterium]